MIATWSLGSGGETIDGNIGPGYPEAIQPASMALIVLALVEPVTPL